MSITRKVEKGVKNEYNNKAVEYKWLKKEISVEVSRKISSCSRKEKYDSFEKY